MPKGSRGERVHLPEDLVKAVENSFHTTTAVQVLFETEAEAKGVHTKLRAKLNKDGHGLRTWGPTENGDGNWEMSFKGSETISAIDDSDEAVQKRVAAARAKATSEGTDPEAAEDAVYALVEKRANRS